MRIIVVLVGMLLVFVCTLVGLWPAAIMVTAITISLVIVLTNTGRSVSENLFTRELTRIDKCIMSVNIKQDFFGRYDKDSAMWQAFTTLRDAIKERRRRAHEYVKHYDYVMRPSPTYLHKQVNAAEELARKISELSDLCLQIDDAASDVDASYVGDLMSSLQDLIEED